MVPRTRNLIIGGVLVVVLAAAAVIGISALRTAIRTSLEAESRFHAAITVHSAILRFESQHGRRPTSWDEFSAMTPLEWSGFELPRDIEPIQQWVTIDFESLQNADPVTDAIHPTGTTYGGWEDLVPSGVPRRE